MPLSLNRIELPGPGGTAGSLGSASGDPIASRLGDYHLSTSKLPRPGRVNRWLDATALTGAALAVVVAAPAVLVTAVMAPGEACAQDYTSGAVNASVVGDNGKPVAGATVKLKSAATGVTTNLTTTGSGSARASGLAPGDYTVEVNAPGFQAYSGVITIAISQESRFTITLSRGTSVKEVVVTGTRVKQEFTSTTTGVTVDVVKLAQNEPIARNVTAVTLLAPSAVQGVNGFGNVPSIGGGSVAENAYYINGLNITNPDTYIGGSTVPFDFYKSVEVKTGGYAAEFGRATGGVVNAVTKSGTNQFMFAAHENWEGRDLRSTSPDTYQHANHFNWNESQQASVEAGGPIIRDHLFAYGLYQFNDVNWADYSITGGNVLKYHQGDPFYGAKVDGYLNADHHLEFTYFTTKTDTDVLSYAWPGAGINSKDSSLGAFQGKEVQKTGGDNWVGKYTGKLTNWFTISAAYGVNQDAGDTLPANTSAYFVRDQTGLFGGKTPGTYYTISTQQPYSNHTVDDTDRRFWRVDGDLTFEAFGHHHVRFGIDHEDLKENKVTALNGALPIEYNYRSRGLQVVFEHLGGHVSAADQAFYIQDSWDVTKTLNLEIGLRNDGFQQSNLSNQKYLSLNDNWGPRLGFSWDPTGERRFKVFGNFGVYYIPPAMNLGFRGRDDYFAEYFRAPDGSLSNFTIDPVTGLPAAIGAARTDATVKGLGYTSNCPTDISAAPGHPVNQPGACLVFGGNVQDPAWAKVAPGTQATLENEFILGGAWKINDLWSVGASTTYRELNKVSEDTDFAPYLANYWCGKSPVSTQCDFYSNNSAYYIWNPGGSHTTLVDWLDKTQKVTLTKANSGMPNWPKPKRAYQDLVLEAHRAFDGKWSWNGSLTLSRSYGNYEGTVKSDAGNGAQTDAGSTQDYDYIGLTDYSTGLLPNHHGYQLKSWGFYQLTRDILIGANLRVISPMHGSCEGFHPTDPNAAGYGASSFYCGGNPSPRGTGWTSDWEKTLDVALRYTVPHKYERFGKLVLRADVFNVFDSHAVLQRDAVGDANGGQTNPTYKYPLVYQTPRYVRLGADFIF